MKKIFFIVPLLFLLSCDIVKFKTISLYDSFEQPPIEEKEELIVFDDSEGTLWSELGDCGSFEITNEVAYSGKNAIKIPTSNFHR